MPVSLEQLVGEVRELLGSIIPRTITVAYDFPQHLPMVAGDPSQLRQVVMNLLTNAAEAIGRRSGTIRVAAGTRTLRTGDTATTHAPGALGLAPGSYVWLEVRDDGIGMDAETLDRIFDPFFTTKPVGVGTGLGLSISYGIVQDHGGTIEVDSSPDKGSCFSVRLPLRPPTRAAQRAVQEAV